VADELKQTLYAASGRAEALAIKPNYGGESPAWNVDNTYAGTHDASDATFDHGQVFHDSTDQTGAAGHVRYVLDSCTYSGTISFLRFKWRAKMAATGGGTVEIETWFSGAARAGSQAATTSWVDYYYDRTVDKKSDPWTQTTVNALTGTQAPGVSVGMIGEDENIDLEVWVSEFCVEVWGPEPVAQSVEVGAGATAGAGIVIAAQSSVEVGAGAVGGAGQVASPGAVAVIVGAGAVASAGIGSPAQSFAYNTGLRVDASVLKIDGTNYNPLSIPATNYRLAIRHLRAFGLPHFAFASEPLYSTGFGGTEHSLYVTFAMLVRPPVRSTLDDIHWIISMHEVYGQQKELYSIGVTPSGRLIGWTRENGAVMSPINTVPMDGVFREAGLQLFSSGPRRRLFLDGQCLVDVTGGYELDLPQPGGEYESGTFRFTMFNGRDGLSCLDAAVVRVGYYFTDYAIEWPIDEGHGGTLRFIENDIPSRLTAPLVATWWNGQPILASPEDQNANVKSAYTWKYITPYTARVPARVEYTKVGGP